MSSCRSYAREIHSNARAVKVLHHALFHVQEAMRPISMHFNKEAVLALPKLLHRRVPDRVSDTQPPHAHVAIASA